MKKENAIPPIDKVDDVVDFPSLDDEEFDIDPWSEELPPVDYWCPLEIVMDELEIKLT